MKPYRKHLFGTVYGLILLLLPVGSTSASQAIGPKFSLRTTRRFQLNAELPLPHGISFLPAAHYAARVEALPGEMRFVRKGKTLATFAAPTNVVPPYEMHLLVTGAHTPAVFVTKNKQITLESLPKWPVGFDPRSATLTNTLQFVLSKNLHEPKMTLSAGIGQADTRFVTTGRHNTPYMQDGRLFFTFSARAFGSYLGVMSFDPDKCDFQLEGVILFDYGDGLLRNDVAADLFYDDVENEWRAYVCNFSTTGDTLSQRAKGGINCAWSKTCPLFGVSVMKAKPLGLEGMNEDPDGCWDEQAKKWRLLVSEFVPHGGIRASLWESNDWDGPFRRLTEPVAENSTGTTLALVAGRKMALAGSANQAFYTYDYPSMHLKGCLDIVNPPWEASSSRNGRSWPAYAELPNGKTLLLTFDRVNFPGMPKPNWTYGGLYLYTSDACIRSAAAALAVSPEESAGPVAFDFIGTALGKGGRTFLLRDETAGIVLVDKTTNNVTWAVGDRVRVRGDMAVNPDERRFAHVRELDVLERCKPPEPVSATGGEILDGRRNFQFVTVEGVVQGTLPDDLDRHYTWIALRTSQGVVMAAAHDTSFSGYDWRTLVDAEVSLSGLVIPASGWRHGFQPLVTLDTPRSVSILRPQPADPFSPDPQQTQPTLHRRRLSGRVLAATDSRCYIRTIGNRFVEVEPATDVGLPAAGDILSVSGFSETDGTRLRLTEAVFRPLADRAAVQDSAQAISFEQLFPKESIRHSINTDWHGMVVTIDGRVNTVLTDNTVRHSFGLTSGNRLIIVDCSGLSTLCLPPAASTVQITGVLLAEFGPVRPSIAFPIFRRFTLVPRTPADLLVIRHPPWWTPLRLLLSLLVLTFVLIGVLIWNRTLNVRANRRGEELAREQLAYRAASLKVEERTRLAVEIHDAISQTLTGIALLFDSAADEASTPSLRKFFAIARQMLASCRRELKGCLWDLRTRTFEEKDLTEAIHRTLQPYSDEANLHIRFNVPRELLSETLAHDILRIVRELVVNALRHGRAQNISVAGTQDGNMIHFAVEDDGCGFEPANAPGPSDGHFGLQGIRERIKSHRGTIEFASVRPHGTRIRITLNTGDEDNDEG